MEYRQYAYCYQVVILCILITIQAQLVVDDDGNSEDACVYTFLVPKREECSDVFERLQQLEDTVQQQEDKIQRLDAVLQNTIAQLNLKSTYPDCDSVSHSISTPRDGVYVLQPSGFQSSFHAFCEISDEESWTVIQRRLDGSVDFYRDWEAYKQGFGNWRGEYWLGNEKIHYLTNQADYKLRIELEDWAGATAYAEYSEFWISGETDNYRLHVGQYSGSAGDAMIYHNGHMFSTKDRDNDERSSGSCAITCKGSWWYTACYNSNLNSLYREGGPYLATLWDGLDWLPWRGSHYSMKKVTMKIQRQTTTSPHHH
ncbi:angiopoietin-related protein 1-like [Glandiceps talaboti]